MFFLGSKLFVDVGKKLGGGGGGGNFFLVGSPISFPYGFRVQINICIHIFNRPSVAGLFYKQPRH